MRRSTHERSATVAEGKEILPPRGGAIRRTGTFVPTERATPRVNIDYHVDFDERLYSAPHTLVGERVEIRASTTTVEIWYGGQRVHSHLRSYGPRGTAVTCEAHRPPSHRDYGKWPPERLVGWAAKLGPNVARVAEMPLAQYPRPEMGYRAVLGIIRVGERHGARFDVACAHALEVCGSTAPRRKYIEALLKRGLERAPAGAQERLPLLGHHENVRGSGYYDKENRNAD